MIKQTSHLVSMGSPPHVAILNMLEAISTSQYSMSDEVSGNIVADLRKRGTFGGFSGERMQLLIYGMWNKVEYALKDSQKAAGQLEECFDSKEMQSVLNGRTSKYIFWRGTFDMLPLSYKCSHCLCLNNFLQVLLIGNQRNQVTSFGYINKADEVSNFL